jgi:hypothetical protein
VAGGAVYVTGAQGGLKYHVLRTTHAPAEPLRDSVGGREPGELQHGVVAEYLAADVFDAFDVGEELFGLVGHLDIKRKAAASWYSIMPRLNNSPCRCPYTSL